MHAADFQFYIALCTDLVLCPLPYAPFEKERQEAYDKHQEKDNGRKGEYYFFQGIFFLLVFNVRQI